MDQYSLVWTVASLTFVGLVIYLARQVLMSGDRPVKMLVWLIVLFFMPIIGVLLYVTFGINRRRHKFHDLKSSPLALKHFEKADEFFKDLADPSQEAICKKPASQYLESVNIHSGGFKPTKGNEVQILKDGIDTFEAIYSALEKAEKFIHMQYYIFEDGQIADRLQKIFFQKLEQGVEVRLLYDGVGSMSLDKSFLKDLQEHGVHTASFFPLYVHKIFNWNINYRNHRKIIVIDGKVGFTGGINVSNKYITDDSPQGKWYDHHLQIEGPAVWSLNSIFTLDWFFTTDDDTVLDKKYFPSIQTVGESIVQIVSSGPDSRFPSVALQYNTMFHSARKYIYIFNPYLIPDHAIVVALQTAALSGVDVRILLPEKSDSKFVKWAMSSYFEELLMAKVKIILYQPGFLHSKVIVIDDEIASVGTANLDIRSFYQNFENNAVLFDSKLSIRLRDDFMAMAKEGREVTINEIKAYSGRQKLLMKLSRIMSPIM